MSSIINLSLVALIALVQIHCQAPSKEFIQGEGEAIQQEITVGEFTGVDLGISGEVNLTQGSPAKILVEGQKNIIDNIRLDVDKGTWDIYFDKSVRNAKDVRIDITMPTIDEASLSGSGTMRSKGKFVGLDQLNINLAGSGNMSLDYEASITDVDLTGSGQISLSGKSKKLSISITGSGNVAAADLVTDECEVEISGSGNATVLANSKLDSRITGSGNVRYAGTASVNSSITGSGNVHKISQ